MDSTSWQLVKSIFQHCNGVIFITAVRPKVNAAPPSNSAAMANMIKVLTPKHGSIRSAGQEHHYHDLQTSIHKSSSVNVEELLSHTDPNVMSLTLHPLTSTAVDELVHDVYKKQFTDSAELAPLSKRIFDLSGGNPLYATELSKIAMDRLHQELSSDYPSEEMKVISVTEINWSNILSFQSGRIEEVIFYRFDQLDFTAQVLLKAASVVCAHGANFTMHILTFVINSSNFFNSDYGSPSHTNTKSQAHVNLAYSADLTQLNLSNSIILALQKLIEKNAFIKILKEKRKSMSSMRNDKMPSNLSGVSPVNTAHLLSTGTQGDHSAAIKLADEISPETNFHFIATVEQHAIYNIMTDDQKQLLHRCVAEYYHVTYIHNLPCATPLIADRDPDSSQPLRCMSVFEYVEQARHYEKAKMYRDSLYCYYRAINMQIDMGVYENYHEQLEYLYYILQHSLVHNHSKNHFSSVKTSSNQATLVESEGNPENNSCHNLRKSILCRQSLSFLKISLHVLLLLMKSFLFGKYDLSTVSQLSEEAHLVILTLLEHSNGGVHQENSGHSTMSRVRIATRTESNHSCFNTRESFVDIHSHHSVYDSVLVVLLNDYLNITRMQLHQEHEGHAVTTTQISSAVDLFHRLSASQEMQACMLLANVRRILNSLHSGQTDRSELDRLTQETLSAATIYTESLTSMSLELTTFLGVDLLPYIFSLIAQKLMANKDKSSDAEAVAMMLLSILSKIDNQAMTMAVIPLTLILIQLGKLHEAYELYHVKFFAKRRADKVDYLPQHRTSIDAEQVGNHWMVTRQMLEEFDFYVQAVHWHAHTSQAPREILDKMAESDVMKRLTVGAIKKHPHLQLITNRQHDDEKLRNLIGVAFHAVRAHACYLMHELLRSTSNPPASLGKISVAAKGHLEHCVRSRRVGEVGVGDVGDVGDVTGGKEFEDLFVRSLSSLLT
ncbi:hypothetical protein EON65_08515 [archaeon]|nr:MAG: hypothetical protein EON65_08515 [archaeon]